MQSKDIYLSNLHVSDTGSRMVIAIVSCLLSFLFFFLWAKGKGKDRTGG